MDRYLRRALPWALGLLGLACFGGWGSAQTAFPPIGNPLPIATTPPQSIAVAPGAAIPTPLIGPGGGAPASVAPPNGPASPYALPQTYYYAPPEIDPRTASQIRGEGCDACKRNTLRGFCKACLRARGLGCVAHHDQFGCSSFRSQSRFAFGSCRAFFGEACRDRPLAIPLPPGAEPPPFPLLPYQGGDRQGGELYRHTKKRGLGRLFSRPRRSVSDAECVHPVPVVNP